MAQFKNAHDSHAHSLKILNTLREYDTFLESLTVVADMGCGTGLDAEWFATLTTRDENPEPLNYIVYAVDQHINRLEVDTKKLTNIVPSVWDRGASPSRRQSRFRRGELDKTGRKEIGACGSGAFVETAMSTPVEKIR